jgi:hypothetical protein
VVYLSLLKLRMRSIYFSACVTGIGSCIPMRTFGVNRLKSVLLILFFRWYKNIFLHLKVPVIRDDVPFSPIEIY